MKKIILFIALAFLLVQCKQKPSGKIHNPNVVGFISDSAMVVSAREEASKIGVAVLKKVATLLMPWLLRN